VPKRCANTVGTSASRHDGDADAFLLCDETGALIDGDDIMAHLRGADMLGAGAARAKKNRPRQHREWSKRRTGKLLFAKRGLRWRATAVGDKNVIDEMLRRFQTFGDEQSGPHLIFRDYSTR